jgi:hypothetical protein
MNALAKPKAAATETKANPYRCAIDLADPAALFIVSG